jgi:glycosyltransferase involved in cell wall biosynthesis
MRVLIVPEYAAFGGTLTFFLQLLEAHQAANIETAILIQPHQTQPDIMQRIHALGVPAERMFVNGWGAISQKTLALSERVKWVAPRLHAARNWLQRYTPQYYDAQFTAPAIAQFNPDLITVVNGTPGATLGVMAHRAPCVFVFQTYPTSRQRRPTRWFARWASAQRKNQFVTVSRYSAKLLESHIGIPFERTQVIYNTHRPEALEPRTAPPSEHPTVQFLWLGDGPLYEEYRAKAAASAAPERITFAGYHSNVDDYYARAAIYLHPSLIENHSMAICDAMAHGLPCVASAVGGNPESVIENETGFVCGAEDIEAMSARILQLLNDADLRKRMGAAGAQRAAQLFSPQVQATAYLDLYRRLARA